MFKREPDRPQDRFDKMFSYFDRLVKWTYSGIGILIGLIIVGSYLFFSNRLDDISKQAEATALSETRKKVDEQFQRDTIQQLIQAAAKKEISTLVPLVVRQEMDKSGTTKTDLIMSNAVSDAIKRMREDNSTGLDEIQNILEDHTIDPQIRISARRQYQAVIKQFERNLNDTSLAAFAGALGIDPRDTLHMKANLIELLKNEWQPSRIYNAVTAMRKITGVPFGPFDKKAVLQWYVKSQEKKPSK